MPLIRVLRIRLRRDLVRMSPVVTGRGLYFDHVGTKIRQDYSGAGASDEARQVYYFQSGKNILSRHCLSLMSVPPAVAGGCHLKFNVSAFIRPTRYRRWYLPHRYSSTL